MEKRNMADGFVRVFVAVVLGDTVRAALAEAIRLLRKTHPRVKWVAPENIHLTLAFLGEVPVERVEEIGSALEGVAAVSGAFSCAVKGVGWFGSPRSPRVVWAGIPEDPALMRLQADVAGALRQLGFTPEDRPFHPHLTMGRVKFSQDAIGLTEILREKRDTDFGAMPVERVLVMRSELRPQGPVYSVLREAVLPAVSRG